MVTTDPAGRPGSGRRYGGVVVLGPIVWAGAGAAARSHEASTDAKRSHEPRRSRTCKRIIPPWKTLLIFQHCRENGVKREDQPGRLRLSDGRPAAVLP